MKADTPSREFRMKKKGERKMRKYTKNGELEAVICNHCAKKLAVKDGIVREGVLMIDHAWDYFSEKDGEVHHLDLCEECYDQLIQRLRQSGRICGFLFPCEESAGDALSVLRFGVCINCRCRIIIKIQDGNA